jgi:hypothetical protein
MVQINSESDGTALYRSAAEARGMSEKCRNLDCFGNWDEIERSGECDLGQFLDVLLHFALNYDLVE